MQFYGVITVRILVTFLYVSKQANFILKFNLLNNTRPDKHCSVVLVPILCTLFYNSVHLTSHDFRHQKQTAMYNWQIQKSGSLVQKYHGSVSLLTPFCRTFIHRSVFARVDKSKNKKETMFLIRTGCFINFLCPLSFGER